MEKEYNKIRTEIMELLSKLNNEPSSYDTISIYKLYRQYLKLSMKISTNKPKYNSDKTSYPYGNCYSYALGFHCPEEFAKIFDEKCAIAFPFNIGLMNSFFTSYDKLSSDLDSDLDSLDIKHYDIDYDEPCSHGGYKISLYETDDDFHFIRENSDGSWSHKIGFDGEVSKVKPSKYLLGYYEYIKTMEIVKPVVRELK